MDSPTWYGHHCPVPHLVAVACVRSLVMKNRRSPPKSRDGNSSGLRQTYGQMQWNAPAGLQPGGQGINELSLANKAAGCAQITIADATQKPTLNIRMAIFLDNILSSFRAPVVPT